MKQGTEAVCVHLFLSPILHESRLYREAQAVIDLKRFSRVIVVGIEDRESTGSSSHPCGLEIIRSPSLGRRASLAGNRIGAVFRKGMSVVSRLVYAKTALKACLEFRPEYVTCHNPTLLPLGWLITGLVGAKLCYSPHELETAKTGLGVMGRCLAWACEWSVVRKAESVVAVCEPIARHYSSRFKGVSTVVIRSIPAGSNMALPDAIRLQLTRVRAASGSGLVFIYQGDLSRYRGIALLLDTFLCPDCPHGLVLMGYGECEGAVIAAQSRCPRVAFVPALPLGQMLEVTKLADVGIFVLDGRVSESYRLSLPNKFFEYVQAGIAVLVSNNLPLLSDLIQREELGWVIEADRLGEFLAKFPADAVTVTRGHVRDYAARNRWDEERLKLLAAYP